MPLTLAEAIQRVPFLAGAKELKTSLLTGGITNLNYRIVADGNSYVLRITGADTELLGIRREVEHAANLAAGRLGVAPEVVYFIEPDGYLVTRFVEGAKIPPEEMVHPHNLRRVAEKVRRFHQKAPSLPGEFNVFRRVEMLSEVSRRHNCRFPDNFDWIMQRMRQVEHSLGESAAILHPCHNDLLNLNFLDEQGEIRILDWEYAGMGDATYDLANFSLHHRLNDDQLRLLLQVYFGEATEHQFARLKLLWPMSEIHEAMWGTTQTGISKLEEDFQAYADLWFGRATQAMQDPRWEGWIRDVAEP
ncbi:MAG: phosphotransferase [Anaerolineales bacterium]